MCDYEFDNKICNPKKHKFSSKFSENPNCAPDSKKCPEKFVTCSQCNISYKDFQSAVNHTCMPYKCKLCNTAFLYDFKLKMHKCSKRKLDKTESDESSAIVSSITSHPESKSSPDNKIISEKKSNNCHKCGKKLSPRCVGVLCANCKNKAQKGSKYTLRCKSLYKCMSSSSLSEVSSSDGVINSTETQLDACSQFKKILNELDDGTTSSDISDSHAPLPLNLPLKRIRLSMSEKIPKKNNPTRVKTKNNTLRKNHNCSSISDLQDITSLSSSAKRRKEVASDGKISKNNSRESGNTCYSSASESSNHTAPSDQILESANLETGCKDKLDGDSRHSRRYRKLRVSMSPSSLSGNSLGCRLNSTSEIQSNFANCNELDHADDISMSSGISNDHGHESENLSTENVETDNNKCSQKKISGNLENKPHTIEPRFSEHEISCDISCNNVPKTSNLISKDKEIDASNKHSEKNNIDEFSDVHLGAVSDFSDSATGEHEDHLSTKINSVRKKKKDVPVKKSKKYLKRFKHLPLGKKAIDAESSNKHLECDNTQNLVGESTKSNVLIASLESKEKATKRKFSSNANYFKGRSRDAKQSTVKFRHKNFSRKHSSSNEVPVTSLSCSAGNHKQDSSEKRGSCITPANSKNIFLPVPIKVTNQDPSGKSKKHVFFSKISSEEPSLVENSVSNSANLCSVANKSSTGNRKQKTGHITPSSSKSRCSSDKINEKNKNLLESNSFKSTVNSVSDNRKSSQQYGSRELEENMKKDYVSDFVTLGCLLKALPDYGVVVMKGSINDCNTFRCLKCNYVFRHIKKATDHTRVCLCPRYKEKEPVLLKDIEFVCAACYQHWSSANELYVHKKCRPLLSCSGEKLVSNSNVPISDYIYHYENANKNHVCPKCSYSCLSLHTFNQHQCEKRLELMKTCVVAVEKLTKHDLATFDNLSKFECPSCQDVFFDKASFQNHSKKHVNVGLNAAKSSVHCGKAYAKKEIKKIINTNTDCNSVDDIKKRVLDPISKIFSCMDSDNFFPDLDLDVSMSYNQQKLFSEAAKQVLSEKIEDLESLTKTFKVLRENFSEDSDSKDSSIPSFDEHTPSTSTGSASMGDFHCKCKKEIDPKVEAKPCLKCLNEYMMNKMNDNLEPYEDSTVVQNKDCATTSSVSSSAAVSDSDSAVLAGSVTAAANNFSVSNVSHDTISAGPEKSVPHFSDVSSNGIIPSSVPSNPVLNVTSVVETSDLCQMTSDNDISAKHSVTPSVLVNSGEFVSLKSLPSDGVKILCYHPNAGVSSVNQETFSGTMLCSNVKKTLSAHCRPITISAEMTLVVLQDIFLNSKSDKVILFVDIECENCSESDKKRKKVAFLETLLDVSHPDILTSPVTPEVDCESSDSDCKSCKDPSPNFLEQPQTSLHFDDIQSKQSLTGSKCIFYWEFEELMSFFLCHENDFRVSFHVQPPFSVKIMVDWYFDSKTEYSVYVLKSSEKYACAICLEELSVSSLLEHLTAVHKETLINILIT